jgi:hypothetical protein
VARPLGSGSWASARGRFAQTGRRRLVAQGALRDHARLFSAVRPLVPPRASHDEDDRDGAGELRLRERGGGRREDPGQLRPVVDRHRSVRGVPVRRRTAQRREEPSCRDLAGDRRRSLRPAAVRIRAGICIPRLRRVGARRPDVLRRARRDVAARRPTDVPPLSRGGLRGPGCDAAGLGGSPVDGVSGGAAETIHRAARRGRGTDADGGGPGRPVAWAAGRSGCADRGLGAGREAYVRGTRGVAARGAAGCAAGAPGQPAPAGACGGAGADFGRGSRAASGRRRGPAAAGAAVGLRGGGEDARRRLAGRLRGGRRR